MIHKLKFVICCLWVCVPCIYLLISYLPLAGTSAHAINEPLRSGRTGAPPPPQVNTKKIDFARDIEPIFKASCYACHSEAKAQADLRLDTAAAASRGGVSGPVIRPGNSRESLLLARVLGHGGGMRMPPGGKLSDEQIGLIAAWIDQGAEWPGQAVRSEAMPASAAADQRLPTAGGQPHATGTVDFVRDIQPILRASCYECHSGTQPKGGLRLDAKALALSGGVSGKVIMPGRGEASRVIHRLRGLGDEARMPLGKAPLSPEQIALISRWIDEGARWPDGASVAGAKIEKHWAFVPPARPSPPPVKETGWIRNPIDNFILARLESEKLSPAPEADKPTLLRRLTYDLTGLPPSVAEIESFLTDSSPDAYEKQVERLLGSPHYGERMAMQWLDIARYADTHGYHIDSHRDMWPWRDWVIRAFNRNLPFDQFTIEQLAGDLLPEATVDQKIASGFNRNHMINFEGGAIPEEYQVEYVVDRVETTATAWMGMTMGCARCHNHKYDPLTQKEFYQFSAFFNNVPEKGLDGKTGNAEPFLSLPTLEQKAQLADLDTRIKNIETELSSEQVKALQEDWEKTRRGRITAAPRDGITAHFELDGNFSDVSGHYRHGRTVRGDPTFGPGVVGRAVSFDGDTQINFDSVSSASDHTGKFSLAVWLRPSSNVPITVLQQIDDSVTRRGLELFFDNLTLNGIQRYAAPLTIRLAARWPESALQLRTRQLIPFGEWHHLALTYDGSAAPAGLKVYVDGLLCETELLQHNLIGSVPSDIELRIGDRQLGKPYKGQLDDLRLYARTLTSDEVTQLAIHHPAQTILSGVTGKQSKEEEARLRDYFLTHAAPEKYRRSHADLKALTRRRTDLNKQILSVMVMGELEKPRETFVLARGDYRNRTERVEAGVPAVLPPLTPDAPPNRLALARWLTDPAHPLTARVAVNRFWQIYFGTGLVKTSEDFGTRGETPSHPELLDWLATEFIRRNWDVRAMQRLIVTSAAYRQSSKVTPALFDKDPENRLVARGPRFRLPAEMIRDNALAASGLLNAHIGGPSVYPYQPKGLWEEMAFGDGFSAQEYRESAGRDLYRRSLYTFWKRTVPPPALVTFDAPDREKCTVRRALTNTPLQALVLLNDPTYIEAARNMAQRVIVEGGKDVSGRVTYAFRLATARRPSPKEARILHKLLRGQLDYYRRYREAATKLAGVGASKPDPTIDLSELAAWTTVASAILNLDETITKE